MTDHQTIRPPVKDGGQERVVETPVAARQGFLGKPVLMVLVISIVLAIAAGLFLGYLPGLGRG